MWLAFLGNHNGRILILQEDSLSSDILHLYTDAASSLGFGIICKEHWAFGEWPEAWKTKNIVILELYPIILDVHMFGDSFQNHCVIFHTDNKTLMHIINKQTLKDNQTMT